MKGQAKYLNIMSKSDYLKIAFSDPKGDTHAFARIVNCPTLYCDIPKELRILKQDKRELGELLALAKCYTDKYPDDEISKEMKKYFDEYCLLEVFDTVDSSLKSLEQYMWDNDIDERLIDAYSLEYYDDFYSEATPKTIFRTDNFLDDACDFLTNVVAEYDTTSFEAYAINMFGISDARQIDGVNYSVKVARNEFICFTTSRRDAIVNRIENLSEEMHVFGNIIQVTTIPYVSKDKMYMGSVKTTQIEIIPSDKYIKVETDTWDEDSEKARSIIMSLKGIHV